MRVIPFSKVQSIGNDFVLLERGIVPDDEIPALAVRLCERRVSVGSDGLLVLSKEGDGLVLRMFNPDGSEDFCGNGLRCAVQYATFKGWIDRQTTISHLGKLVPAEVLPDGSIKTEIGRASFAPADVPHTNPVELFEGELDVQGRKVRLSALSTGSTHSVIFVDALPGDDEEVSLGSALEHHPLFPERTSVIWVHPVAEHQLDIRIWERGAGETLGCGTGSSAAAVAYSRRSGVTGSIEVRNPGGTVVVDIAAWDAPLSVTGRASVVFEGEFEDLSPRR